MSQGVSGAGRDYGRRRRWLAQLPEEGTPPPMQRERTARAKPVQEPLPESDATTARPVSSLLPRSPWALGLMIAGALLSWIAIVGGGAWLDHQQLEPWQGILGLQAGRLLRFYTSVSLLTCAQLSYLILWRRSRSRKDFAGRYRVWFWIGAVCSTFCVASVTRFHENWAYQLTSGLQMAWIDTTVLCWMVPATTMLLAAMHLLRRDLPFRSASSYWIQAGRGLAIASGIGLVMGSLILPDAWVAPVQAALGALWPTVLGCGLLTYARYVTYISNEAEREQRVERRSRWMTRIQQFAGHVNEMAREEWQVYLARREQAKANVRTAEVRDDKVESTPASPPVRNRSEASERATAPLRKMMSQKIDPIDDQPERTASGPITRAASVRPLNEPSAVDDEFEESDEIAAPRIPAPHFPISQSEVPGEEDRSRSQSRKDRKKARRV